MNFIDIVISEKYTVTNIHLFMDGYLKGYVQGIVCDKEKDIEYELLYRVYDPKNGEEYEMISIDYGWELDDGIFQEIENKLTIIMKNTNHAKLYIDI